MVNSEKSYRYREEAPVGRGLHHADPNTGARKHTFRDMSVEQGAPILLPYLDGRWISHVWAGRREQIQLSDRVTWMNQDPYVLVRRLPPWTGGWVPVAHVVDALKLYRGYQTEAPDTEWGYEAFTPRVSPCLAIVVWHRQEKTA